MGWQAGLCRCVLYLRVQCGFCELGGDADVVGDCTDWVLGYCDDYDYGYGYERECIPVERC